MIYAYVEILNEDKCYEKISSDIVLIEVESIMNNRDFRVGERMGTRESIAGKLQLEWKKICVVMHGRVTVGRNNII